MCIYICVYNSAYFVNEYLPGPNQQLKDAVTDTDDTTLVFPEHSVMSQWCHNYKIIVHKFHHRPNYSLVFQTLGQKIIGRMILMNLFASYIKKKS